MLVDLFSSMADRGLCGQSSPPPNTHTHKTKAIISSDQPKEARKKEEGDIEWMGQINNFLKNLLSFVLLFLIGKISFLSDLFLRLYLFIFRERERKGVREGETH